MGFLIVLPNKNLLQAVQLERLLTYAPHHQIITMQKSKNDTAKTKTTYEFMSIRRVNSLSNKKSRFITRFTEFCSSFGHINSTE